MAVAAALRSNQNAIIRLTVSSERGWALLVTGAMSLFVGMALWGTYHGG